MNEIRTLKIEEYRDCKMYVRNIGNIFEYLVIADGELYTMHIVVTKTLFQTISGADYTQKQMLDTTNYLLRLAQTTIDFIRNKQK